MMKTSPSQLDKASFEALLAALHRDPAEAGHAYERLRQRLIRFFLLHGVASPEDLADQSLDRLARKLNEGEIVRQVPAYLAGIARLILLEERSRVQREQKGREQIPVGQHASGDEDPAWEAVERCLKALPAESRDLIQRYYSADGRAKSSTRSRMAEELGISHNALRNRALRIRQELEKCAEK